ncbi:hypothetical protein [Acidimangrovimonas pyrenivorans]|uniref:Sulfotransferase family protein n=1 Tax=Acidimangrovimonas pyrenivorans TaxID=2030798 RepID=A0ABV7ANB1_9RHOB
MHKTGSSSIQQTFSGFKPEGYCYFDWKTPNHSPLFALLFHEPVESYHRFSGNAEPRQQLLAERAQWRDKLIAFIEENRGATQVFSAEDISGRYEGAVAAMRDFFAEYYDEIEVIAYVRPPISYMQSGFQQMVKGGGLDVLEPRRLWPNYRGRFEKLERVFGADRVRFRKFGKDSLVGGDVVTDFAAAVGAELPKDRIVRANDSLSLEAVALLFAQRRLGEGFVRGFEGAHTANNRFIRLLSRIGEQKLVFAPALTDPMVEANRADLDWMEARLDAPLLDTPGTGGRQIASEDDLLAVAEENLPALEELLATELENSADAPRTRLVRRLEMLRRLSY